jgi:hypothetical protein
MRMRGITTEVVDVVTFGLELVVAVRILEMCSLTSDRIGSRDVQSYMCS